MQDHKQRSDGPQGQGRGQQQHHCAQRMGCRSEPGRQQRMQVSKQTVFRQPAADLRGSDQRRYADGRRHTQSRHPQQLGQVRRHRGTDEPGNRKNRRQGQCRAGSGAPRLRRRLDRFLIRAGHIGARAIRPGLGMDASRQSGIEGQTQQQMGRCPTGACPAPAPSGLHPRRQGPAHRAGEPGYQGDAGDGVAGLFAVDAHQRRKGGFVKAAAHGHADEGPGCEQAPRPLRQGQSGQTSRENQAGHRQDHVTAMVVNRPPGPWSQWCGNQHRERKS